MDGLRRREVVVLAGVLRRRGRDDLLRLEVLQVLHDLVDVRLVARGLDRLRDRPLFALLLEDDLTLLAVGDAHLVDVVGRLDLGQLSRRRGRRTDLLVLVLRVIDRAAEAGEDHDTGEKLRA